MAFSESMPTRRPCAEATPPQRSSANASRPPWRRRDAKRALGVERGARRTRVRRSEEAREWEGYYPPANLTETTAADRALLAAKGFVPLPVSAGDLVVFPGTLDHLSFPNGSPHARHTFRTARPRSTIAPNPTLLAPGTHVSKPPHTRAGKPAHPRLC